MVTIRNSVDRDAANSDGEGYILLDELILILHNNEHATSTYGDMLIYVHEKPRCHDMCETDTGIKGASCKKALEAKLMGSEIVQGGKSFVF
jgi:hypothetical protein